MTNFPVSGFLAYDRLRAHRDDLICLRVMGWSDGRQAVDYTINAAIGLPLMTGPVEHSGPVNHVLPAWDLLTGAYAAFCLVSAERSRRETGRGQEIRLPLSDVAIATLGLLGQIAEVQLSCQDRPRMGNELFGAFGRDFETSDGERLMIVAITPRQWTGLLSVLGLEQDVAALEAELGVSFARDEGIRFEHRERLNALVATAVAGRTKAELAPAFERVACAGVHTSPCTKAYKATRSSVPPIRCWPRSRIPAAGISLPARRPRCLAQSARARPSRRRSAGTPSRC